MKTPSARFCSRHILVSVLILLTSVTALTSGCGVQASYRYDQGMVVSADTLASRIGAAVLEAGGNAVDAAVATGFALAVTFPGAGNIGGGGFMVVRLPDGTSTAFDFREKAPLAAHARMFLDENGEYSSRIHHNSHLAVGVPGTVAGFALAHERLGKLPWADLVGPAVELARNGFSLTDSRANDLARYVRRGFQPCERSGPLRAPGIPTLSGQYGFLLKGWGTIRGR